jgi:hypothetical protein
MKSLRQWHSNLVWPPLWLIVSFFVVYGTLEAALWLIQRAILLPESFTELPETRSMRLAIVGGAAFCYAVFRLIRFHPACNQAYAGWLKLSPWTAEKPLPCGPVHLVWQDAVVIGALAAMAKWHARGDPGLPVLIFGSTYLVGFTLLLAYTRTWRHCLVLGFLWPALMLPAAKGLVLIVLAGAIIVVVWRGHRRSLRAFPWQFLLNTEPRPPAKSFWEMEIHVGGLTDRRSSGAGWPNTPLSPKPELLSIRSSTSLALSLLFGWWVYCIVVRTGAEAPSGFLILPFAIFAAILRLALYCVGIAPPFSVFGRIASGQILIPRFDQVFVTPIAVVLLAIAGTIILRRLGLASPAAFSCVAAAVGFVLLNGGPTLSKWILTGQHRYRPPSRLGTKNQVLKPV